MRDIIVVLYDMTVLIYDIHWITCLNIILKRPILLVLSC